ncbi:Uncharacterised protein [Mycobacteroides abscessus subsp. abscessus]|nr:Uncharacterised protein [Mycobacteroides abscessus subsp. abscessus]
MPLVRFPEAASASAATPGTAASLTESLADSLAASVAVVSGSLLSVVALSPALVLSATAVALSLADALPSADSLRSSASLVPVAAPASVAFPSSCTDFPVASLGDSPVVCAAVPVFSRAADLGSGLVRPSASAKCASASLNALVNGTNASWTEVGAAPLASVVV